MKKIKLLFLVVIVITIASCSGKKTNSQNVTVTSSSETQEPVEEPSPVTKVHKDFHGYKDMVIIVVDDIEYHVYSSGSYDGGVFVMNHTVGVLEAELLEKQIESLDRPN